MSTLSQFTDHKNKRVRCPKCDRSYSHTKLMYHMSVGGSIIVNCSCSLEMKITPATKDIGPLINWAYPITLDILIKMTTHK